MEHCKNRGLPLKLLVLANSAQLFKRIADGFEDAQFLKRFPSDHAAHIHIPRIRGTMRRGGAWTYKDLDEIRNQEKTFETVKKQLRWGGLK